jgi:hypothetical protein
MREIETGDKPASLGKAPSRESGNKAKEGSPPSIKSHRSGDKKKKMKRWSTTRPTHRRPPHQAPRHTSLLSTMSARSIVRCPFAIPVFLNTLLYFLFP